MPGRPLVVEAHRRVAKNCRDRRRQLRRSAQKVRQTVPREPCRSLTLILGAPSGGSPSYRFTDARRFSPDPSMIIRSTQTPTDRMNRKMTSEHSSRARGKLKIGDDWNAITIIALSQTSPLKRSEERRVGKECRSPWAPDH